MSAAAALVLNDLAQQPGCDLRTSYASILYRQHSPPSPYSPARSDCRRSFGLQGSIKLFSRACQMRPDVRICRSGFPIGFWWAPHGDDRSSLRRRCRIANSPCGCESCRFHFSALHSSPLWVAHIPANFQGGLIYATTGSAAVSEYDEPALDMVLAHMAYTRQHSCWCGGDLPIGRSTVAALPTTDIH